ncbi:MAG: restriction endonuclease [Opitutae bacterium]|nr:restriction endonuclease [Opitutae bacterium]
MAIARLPKFIRDNYTVKEWRHASSILQADFPVLLEEICDVLTRFRLKKSEVVVGGGSKTKIAGWIDGELRTKGWIEKQFKTAFMVDERRIESPTHKVDCYKATELGGIGFEIEWNNKDPFFDRDLNNFRLLFELRTISVGVILTRAEDLKDLFRDLTDRGLKPSSSFGESTTHWGKLLPRLEGGAGGGCPVLAFGITQKLYTEDVSDHEARELIRAATAAKKAQRRAVIEKRKKKGGGGAIPLDLVGEDEQEDYDAET